MIFNADEILETVLGENDHKACSFMASKSIFETFKKTCRKDGAKNHSPILEEIIKSFLAYTEKEKPINISAAQANDRTAASFSCSASLWESFTEKLPELNLDRARVLEYLMNEYNEQRRVK